MTESNPIAQAEAYVREEGFRFVRVLDDHVDTDELRAFLAEYDLASDDENRLLDIAADLARDAYARVNGARPEEGARPAWHPLPLGAVAAEPIALPRRMSGTIYDDAATLVSGEPGVGKSMIAAAIVAEEARDGGTALFIDFEGTPGTLLERLQAAGLSDEHLEHVLYLRPDAQAEAEEIRAMIARVRPTLVVVDSYDAALSAFGLESKNEDIRAFDALVVRPLRVAGAALVITDHVVKKRDERGPYSIGGQAKLAIVDAHLGLIVIASLRRGKIGKLKVRVHKDRHGHLPRSALFELRSHETTGALSWTLTVDDADDADEPFRPTHLMEKVSIYLEHAPGAVSLTTILDGVRGNRDAKVAAVNALAAEEYATEEPGPRSARMFTSARPYRETEDAAE